MARLLREEIWLALKLAKHGKQEVNSVSKSVTIIFVIACGFVSAALLGSLRAAANGNSPDRLTVSRGAPIATAITFAYCMFAGPYLIVHKAVHAHREHVLPIAAFALVALLALLWSLCSGVFIVQALVLAGLIIL